MSVASARVAVSTLGGAEQGQISFSAVLLKPLTPGRGSDCTFLILPQQASVKLPSQGLNTVDGLFNGIPFQATLEPDGQGGHWLKVENGLRESAGVAVGHEVALEISSVAEEPEPVVPEDFHLALSDAPKAELTWHRTTALAR